MPSNSRIRHQLENWGPEMRVALVRWTPSGSATQTLTEAWGVTSVTRSGAGAYTINLAVKPRAIVAVIPEGIENDTTTYHFVRCESSSATAGTVAISHKSVAFASVASGPSGSDTIDEICVAIVCRVAS